MAKKKDLPSVTKEIKKSKKFNEKRQERKILNLESLDTEDKISDLMKKTFEHFELVYYPERNQCYKDDKLYF